MGKIRSALRNLSRWWKPFGMALSASAHISYYGKKKRVNYLCSRCSKLYPRPEVEVNHIVPVGSLKTYDELPGFCSRLFVEDHMLLEVVCRTCHIAITKEQKNPPDLNC
jgi:DNA-directed RNA polymerase subunit RPC12/RpoP